MNDALATGSEQLWFDSEALPASERFNRYRELYAAGSDAVRLGEDFRAAVRGYRLDRAILYDRTLHDVGHSRDAKRVARDGFDHWTLTHVVSGEVEIDAGWGFAAVEPGETALLDMTRVMGNRAVHARMITVSVARERVMEASSDLDHLHGFILSAEQGGLLGDYLESLARRLPTLAAAAVPAVTRPLPILLAVALAGGDALISPGHADRVRRLIEAELEDPDFGPAALVAQSGLSRATLYRLFQHGGGLALFIQRRRLDRVRQALADCGEARTFAEIVHATGFVSEAHCSRLFQENFGVRPSEYRVTAAAGETPSGRMRHWHDEVR